jgi:hypothetical protein
MPAARVIKEIHPLCYEHHGEMTLKQVLPKAETTSEEPFAYACQKLDCLVHYNTPRGYFLFLIPPKEKRSNQK